MRLGWAFAAGLLVPAAQLPSLPAASPSPPAWEVLHAPAPDARFPRLAGGSTALKDLRGRVVVLDFWTTWCEPCVAELPALHAFHAWARARGDVVLLSINDDTSARELARFLGAHRVRFPVLLMDAGNALRVEVYPTKLILDGKGFLRLRARGGPVPFDELRRRAASILDR